MVAKLTGKAAGWLSRTRDDFSKGYNKNRMTYDSVEKLRAQGKEINLSSKFEPSDVKPSGAEMKYNRIGRAEEDFAKALGPNAHKTENWGEAAGQSARDFVGGLRESAVQGSHGGVLGMAGHHAVRGAIGGGVAGGTIEAAQGGSFWDGAKGGMLHGAVGYGGYRMAGAGLGAKGINPIGKGGFIESAGNMYQRNRPGGPTVSSAVTATMEGMQGAARTRSYMGLR